MNIDKLFDGIKNKEKIVPKLCKLYSLSENNIAYIVEVCGFCTNIKSTN